MEVCAAPLNCKKSVTFQVINQGSALWPFRTFSNLKVFHTTLIHIFYWAIQAHIWLRIKKKKRKRKRRRKKEAKAKSQHWLQCKWFKTYAQLIMYTNKPGMACQGNKFHMFALTVLSTKEIPLNRTIAYCLQDKSLNRCGDQVLFSPLLPLDKTLQTSVISFKIISQIHPM